MCMTVYERPPTVATARWAAKLVTRRMSPRGSPRSIAFKTPTSVSRSSTILRLCLWAPVLACWVVLIYCGVTDTFYMFHKDKLAQQVGQTAEPTLSPQVNTSGDEDKEEEVYAWHGTGGLDVSLNTQRSSLCWIEFAANSSL